MTRRMIPILAFLAAAAAAAPATGGEHGAIQVAFGNTLEMTYPDGRKARLWLEPDGSYTGEDKHRRPSGGRWLVRIGKLCMRQIRPLPVPFHYCTPIVAGAVGATWQGKAVTGESIRIRVAPGR